MAGTVTLHDPVSGHPSDLNFRVLFSGRNLGLIRYDFAVLHQGFNLRDPAFPSLRAEIAVHTRWQGVRLDILLHFEKIALRVNRQIFHMTSRHQLDFIF
jgi:hypothetical protein